MALGLGLPGLLFDLRLGRLLHVQVVGLQHHVGIVTSVKSFRDPGLDAAVNQAIANNLDLQQAAARVQITQQTVTVVGSSLLPKVALNVAGNSTNIDGEWKRYDSGPVLSLALLERRPDVAAAERKVPAAFRQTEAANLALLPGFGLNIAGGRFCENILSVLRLNPWLNDNTLGMTVPIHTGGALLAEIRIATAKQQQEVAHSDRVALVAFRDVDNGLTNDRLRAQRVDLETVAVRDRAEAERIGNLKFWAGPIDLLSLLRLQFFEINAEEILIELKGATSNSRIASTCVSRSAAGSTAHRPPPFRVHRLPPDAEQSDPGLLASGLGGFVPPCRNDAIPCRIIPSMSATPHQAPKSAKNNALAERIRLGSRLGGFHFSAVELLITLIVLLVASPFLEELKHGTMIETILLTALLVSSVLVVGGDRKSLTVATILVVPALVLKWLSQWRPDLVPPSWFFAFSLLVFALVVWRLLRFVLHSPRVTNEVLAASITAYLLIGLIFAFGYKLAGLANPRAFLFTDPAGGPSVMSGHGAIYFSYVTLSTVGYGDIVPLSPLARTLAMTEAMTGTLYVAVLIARLVALQTSNAGRESDRDVDRDET